MELVLRSEDEANKTLSAAQNVLCYDCRCYLGGTNGAK